MPKSEHQVIRLRPATDRDVAAILELEIASFARVEERFNRRRVQDLIKNPRAIALVAESKGKVPGWAVGLLRSHKESNSGRIYAVAVHPDARGKRIGQRLVGRIIHSLVMRGAGRIYLEVHADNRGAINLYRKLGFIVQGYLADYYGPGHHGLRMMRPATIRHTPS